MKSNRKTKVKNLILITIILACLLAIIGGTYSRYTSSGSARGNVDVAKWHIELNNEDISSQSTNVNIVAGKDEISNENVSDGKLAPGQTLSAVLEVNPDGSEVAVDYLLNVGEITAQNFDNNSNITISKVVATVDGGTAEELAKDGNNYIYYENLNDVLEGKKVTFKVYINWENQDTAQGNAADIANADALTNITVPINITARQHLESDGFISAVSIDTVTDLETAVSYLSAGDTLVFPNNANFEGDYAANAYHQVELPNNFTLDLNGKELAITNGSILLAENGLTIKNGTLKGLPDSYGRTYTCIWDYDADLSNITARNITIENVVADGGLNFYGIDNAVLNNVTANATKFYAVYGNIGSTITINSGTYSAASNSTALFGYKATDTDNNITYNNPSDGFKIYGGTFITNGRPFCLTSGHYSPVIYGGTFDCDVSSYVASGHTCIDQGNGTWVVE